jgi:FHA domain-containing protein
MATAKKAAAKKESLKARIAKHLGVTEDEAEARALRELATSIGLDAKAAPKSEPPEALAHGQPSGHYLPQRLYLLLDGRGLDGRGMPVEVIDLPCTIGSEKRCTVWINSPQIETRHLQITHDDTGWVIEDLGSEHGTLIGDQPLKRRIIQNGDEYRLSGYLRLRTELR